MYIMADGRCQNCGIEIGESWHADHVLPWSLGGKTIIANGQALCQQCNLKKGAKINKNYGEKKVIKPWTIDLREWQEDAYQYIIKNMEKENQKHFLVVATPGAGKTLFGLRLAHDFFLQNDIERLVVVCPSRYLKEQWGKEASHYGLDLDYCFENQKYREAEDYHGIATTYAAVASNPDIHKISAYKKTMVIFDEIHHAGTQRPWGDGIKLAYQDAAVVLSMSGTPFRSDRLPLPFVRYDESGSCVPDHSYTYYDGLQDNIVREIFFPYFEGNMEWVVNGALYKSTFSDKLSSVKSSQRLRTALDAKGEWLSDVLIEANAKLDDIRNGEGEFFGDPQANAGGLVFAIDQRHARDICNIFKQKLGITPTLVVSDEPRAGQLIGEFRENTTKWMVAVRMVSEGVDIKRLRVGVYAAVEKTPLIFIQRVGRFVRWLETGPERQESYLYLPKDPELIELVREIQSQRSRHIEQVLEEEKKGGGGGGPTKNELLNDNMFVPLYSGDANLDGFTHSDESYSRDEINIAENIAKEMGGRISAPMIAVLARKLSVHAPTATVRTQEIKENKIVPKEKKQQKTKVQAKAEMRRQINKMVWGYASKLYPYAKGVSKKETDESNEKRTNKARARQTKLNELFNYGQKRDKATFENLEKMIEWLVRNGTSDESTWGNNGQH